MSRTDSLGWEGYEALVAELRAAVPAAPDRLRRRVLGLAPSPRRVRPRRRLALAILPVAAALAVGAALIHALITSGAGRPAARPSLATFGSTKLQNEKLPNRSAKSTLHASTAAARGMPVMAGREGVVIPTNRLVHADASLQVQVPTRAALSRATSAATRIAGSLGGYAQSVQYRSSRRGSGSAFLDLRVPVRRAETAIARFGQLGRLLSQEVSTEDLQQQLTRESNRIGALRRAIAVYEQALANGTLSGTQRVEVEIELENARHALVQARKARSGTIAEGATADISLTLTTRQQGAAAPPHRSGRFDRLLGSAAGFLGLEGIVVLYALVVLSPALVLGGLVWALLRERRRRGERRLLASA
ncbi:MAG TPA: DUF4349 domain-containing protein [Gaiellaceae bacterium]|nr:DUF4349 domain-containing protein [Gaiellaceae bacterium]